VHAIAAGGQSALIIISRTSEDWLGGRRRDHRGARGPAAERRDREHTQAAR
jgi:hypothetical protein